MRMPIVLFLLVNSAMALGINTIGAVARNRRTNIVFCMQSPLSGPVLVLFRDAETAHHLSHVSLALPRPSNRGGLLLSRLTFDVSMLPFHNLSPAFRPEPTMCYSALVVQDLKKLMRELQVFMDYEEAERVFLLRLDDPTVNIAKGFEANFDNPTNDAERRIKAAIDEHRARASTKYEKDLFTQKTRLVNAQRSLQTKETKKAREDVRIATSKIDALSTKLSSLRTTDLTLDDRRVFPLVYGGVIIKRDGRNLLTPMRYYCRPAGKPEFYDKKFPGLFNARRDNLEKFWRDQFGQHHAIAVVESFFEWVKLHTKEHRELAPGEQEKSIELQFKPTPPRPMFVACLWSEWTDPKLPYVRGFAAITDEPPQEVSAAGHDRCVINIKPENVDAWLTPAAREDRELQSILSDREVPYFENEEVLAA